MLRMQQVWALQNKMPLLKKDSKKGDHKRITMMVTWDEIDSSLSKK